MLVQFQPFKNQYKYHKLIISAEAHSEDLQSKLYGPEFEDSLRGGVIHHACASLRQSVNWYLRHTSVAGLDTSLKWR